MNWLQDLLTNPDSIAHIVALYSFVIAAGVLLGKIKVFGISLGVTFVLFVGILAGHFGFTGNASILSFIQDFGLILFVFCIGLQVGPPNMKAPSRSRILLRISPFATSSMVWNTVRFSSRREAWFWAK
jgi:putative transport protein